ncbi:MAG: acetoacetate decarboxylase family protein [Gaiellales bacterium]
MSKGYSLPLSPGGRANLVPPPPWHYVGDFVVVDYWADPAAVAAVLPPGIEPYAADPGRAAVIFADWQSCTTDRNELVDPARSQYKEAFIVVNGKLGDEHVTTCPYIWVDRDFALVRGWIQGFPKKLGSVWMTRSFGLGTLADPAIAAGSTFGCTMAANDRRLIDATVTLTGESASGPEHNAPPLVNRRHFPQLAAGTHDTPAVHELVRAKSFDRSISAIWEGDATLAFGDAPNEEHIALAPVEVGRGYRFTFAYSVDDLETIADLRGDA